MNNQNITGNGIFIHPEMHVNTVFILIQYMQLFETFFTLASNSDSIQYASTDIKQTLLFS
jgi:hypothetical protein